MDVTETAAGFVTVVSLNGNLDSAGTPSVQEYLERLLRTGKKFLILDFAGVSLITSMGLRMLVILARQIKPIHGRIILACLSPMPRKVLEVAGFLPFLEVCETLEHAKDAMIS
jgi:anti-anti-sigma factor